MSELGDYMKLHIHAWATGKHGNAGTETGTGTGKHGNAGTETGTETGKHGNSLSDRARRCHSLVPRPSNARALPLPKRGNEKHAGRVWQ